MPKSRKRTAKVSAETSDNMSTEAQLSKLDKDNEDVIKVNRSTKSVKQGESVVSVVVGAVQSGDLDLVSSVLSSADTETREDTVLGLPLETVMPLLTLIQACLRKGGGVADPSVSKWLKCILTVHSGYILSHPECDAAMSSLHAELETRTRHHGAVFQLAGKLEMLDKQIRQRQEAAADTSRGAEDGEQQPLLMYQDDSSDELADVIDDLLVPASDTDDDWVDDDNDDNMNGDDSDDCKIVNDEDDTDINDMSESD